MYKLGVLLREAGYKDLRDFHNYLSEKYCIPSDIVRSLHIGNWDGKSLVDLDLICETYRENRDGN